ncbi:MAG: energy-coupling factor transporter ATPase [Oscillospiraceae bacterium]|nr:energy-coupling factor transporter ATPase [Oscillospiraceae bacterium]
MEKFISANGISFGYHSVDEQDKLVTVLDGLNLSINKGEFVAILGHNGCGKSTLAKHFNAVLVPYKGDVIVDGMNTHDEEKIFDIRESVGMVFQNPDNQIVATVVEEDVAFGPENMGIESDEICRRVEQALKDVDMYEYREHAPHRLSGGQKQRVAIAGVLAMRPKCIVMDEPTAMLDPKGRREVMQTVKKMNREHGMTVVLITHYMDEAAQCDRVIVMDKGEVLLDGAPKEVFTHVEMLKNVGLDVPQTTELCFELSKAGVEIPLDILEVDECVDALSDILEKKGVKA